MQSGRTTGAVLFLLSIALVALSFVGADKSEKPKETPTSSVIQNLQSTSVTVQSNSGEGSGWVVTRGDTSFVWTAAHVVEGLRKTRQVTGPDGSTKTKVEFDDAGVLTIKIQNGRLVRKQYNYAKVIRYSDYKYGEDLCLLEVREKGFSKASTNFYLDSELPELGTTVWNCGSSLGQFGANSILEGKIAQHGRILDGKTFMQLNLNAYGGASGSQVTLKDGKIIGMVVRGIDGGFILAVPVDRMLSWAKRAKIEWAVNPEIKMPTALELAKLPVEGGDD